MLFSIKIRVNIWADLVEKLIGLISPVKPSSLVIPFLLANNGAVFGCFHRSHFFYWFLTIDHLWFGTMCGQFWLEYTSLGLRLNLKMRTLEVVWEIVAWSSVGCLWSCKTFFLWGAYLNRRLSNGRNIDSSVMRNLFQLLALRWAGKYIILVNLRETHNDCSGSWMGSNGALWLEVISVVKGPHHLSHVRHSLLVAEGERQIKIKYFLLAKIL